MMSFLQRLAPYVPFYLRLALGITFLVAVADRFGLWGPAGTPKVAWGDFQTFLDYTAVLNPYLPKSWIPLVGWTATVLETVFGLALVAGFQTRWAALGSGFLLLLFALAMATSLGIHAPLNFSVFTASAGAFLLAICPRRDTIEHILTNQNEDIPS